MSKYKAVVNVRAGRIGNCTRALALHMFGVPDIETTGKEVKRIYKDGEAIEEEILDMLREDGYKIITGEVYVRKIRMGDYLVKISGTPDGMIQMKKDSFPIEIKSMNNWRFRKLPDRFSDWVDPLKEKYSFQMGTYVFVCKKRFIYLIAGERRS